MEGQRTDGQEFASEIGINPRSLVFWKWQLGKAAGRAKESPASSAARLATTLPLVELSSSRTSSQFELELTGGRRLTIPSTFESDALRRLLAVLEGAS